MAVAPLGMPRCAPGAAASPSSPVCASPKVDGKPSPGDLRELDGWLGRFRAGVSGGGFEVSPAWAKEADVLPANSDAAHFYEQNAMGGEFALYQNPKDQSFLLESNSDGQVTAGIFNDKGASLLEGVVTPTGLFGER